MYQECRLSLTTGTRPSWPCDVHRLLSTRTMLVDHGDVLFSMTPFTSSVSTSFVMIAFSTGDVSKGNFLTG